eukprot:2469261-Amphidinium_carterae.1
MKSSMTTLTRHGRTLCCNCHSAEHGCAISILTSLSQFTQAQTDVLIHGTNLLHKHAAKGVARYLLQRCSTASIHGGLKGDHAAHVVCHCPPMQCFPSPAAFHTVLANAGSHLTKSSSC